MRKSTNAQHGFGKSGGSVLADTFVVNQSLVLRINIYGELATFAKPETVMGKGKKTDDNV
jgi:hypothetical protein